MVATRTGCGIHEFEESVEVAVMVSVEKIMLIEDHSTGELWSVDYSEVGTVVSGSDVIDVEDDSSKPRLALCDVD